MPEFCPKEKQNSRSILYPTHGHLPQEMIPRVADNIDRVRIQAIEVSKLGILNNNMMIYVQNKDGSKVVEGVIRIFYGFLL